jgi:anti-sigma28 factor (negative regulator of flagellin synthesis)
MRIDDLNRTPVTAATEKPDAAAEKRALRNDSPAGAGVDQANVSELAQTLTARDPERLEQLRLDVQSGTYKVSAETVAEAIIDAHLKE